MNTPGDGPIISIHQPNYLPWLGYFYKIYISDIFVFLDDVQFSNEGMHNYTYVKTSKGSYRLKYPVQQSLGDKIYEVRSKDELRWKDTHLRIIEDNYHGAKFFSTVYNDYRTIVLRDYSNISALNMALIELFSVKLELKTNFVKSSDLNIDLKKSEKIIAICKRLGGKTYYSGIGAKAYQTEAEFVSSDLVLKYSTFKPFQYPQLWSGFHSNVSALDYFMNCGYDWARVLNNQDQ